MAERKSLNITDLIQPRIRFTEELDLYLAREVMRQNPYEEPKRWSIIQVNMMQITGKNLGVRTLKEKMQNLVKKYLEKVQVNEGKSGIEETVTELDDLIQQIVDLMKSYRKKANMRQKTRALMQKRESASSFQKSFDRRELYVGNLQEISSPNARQLTEFNAPPMQYKRSSTYKNMKQVTIQYLATKNERFYEIRSKELSLQERKVALEEKKCEMELEERKRRLEMEEKRLALEENRFNIQLELFQNHQDLIKAASKNNIKC